MCKNSCRKWLQACSSILNHHITKLISKYFFAKSPLGKKSFSCNSFQLSLPKKYVSLIKAFNTKCVFYCARIIICTRHTNVDFPSNRKQDKFTYISLSWYLIFPLSFSLHFSQVETCFFPFAFLPRFRGVLTCDGNF